MISTNIYPNNTKSNQLNLINNMENISSAVRQLPKNIIYAKYLRSKDEAYLKVKGVFALSNLSNVISII